MAAALGVAVAVAGCGGSGLPPNHEHKSTKTLPGETSEPLTASTAQRATVGCPGALEGHGPRCPVLAKGESCFCVCAPEDHAFCEAR